MTTQTLINSAKNNDVDAFKASFSEAVSKKILEKIAEKRAELASGV